MSNVWYVLWEKGAVKRKVLTTVIAAHQILDIRKFAGFLFSLPSVHEREMYRKPSFFSPAACWVTFYCEVQCKQGLSHCPPLPVLLWYIDDTDRQELTPASYVMTKTQGKVHQNGAILYVFCSQFAKASILWRLKFYTLAYILGLVFIVFILVFPHLLMHVVAEAWTESGLICVSPYTAGLLAILRKPNLHWQLVFVFAI